MAVQLDPNVKDDLKTQFITREGTYRLMTLSEYSRPNRVGYTNTQSSPQVRVSIVTLPNPTNSVQQQNQNERNSTNSIVAGGVNQQSTSPTTTGGNTPNGSGPTDSIINERHIHYSNALGGTILSTSIDSRLGGGISMHMSSDQNGLIGGNGCNGTSIFGGDRICFNFGKELYVYAFRGVKKGSELSKPIDKKLYKGTNPSCHDFNVTGSTPDGAPLLVGFTTGQIQLVQPGRREPVKLYNEERLIDKTKVTCLKWLPGSPNLFLASHSSGNLYLYNEELPCTPTAPNYQPFKMGDGYTILTCKSKSTRNPLYKWVFSTENCSINEFCFSPCGSNLAIVSQDGFLRVFHYDTMELLGIARSYFGGFLCVCWSPDGKYIVVGGEDDLVTVWSLHERRVVARGQGHRSWVSVVAFDPYTTSYTNWDGPDFSDDENPMNDYQTQNHNRFNNCTPSANDEGYEYSDNVKSNQNRHHRPNSASLRDSLAPDKLATSYRLGSVSQDTQLCLWDITEDVLRHPLTLRQRLNSTSENFVNTSGGFTATNSSSHLNGDLVNDIKVIKPMATTTIIGGGDSGVSSGIGGMTSTAATTTTTATNNSNINKEIDNSNNSSKNSTNSSSSKFSTANCTISSSPSSATNDTGLTIDNSGIIGSNISNNLINSIKIPTNNKHNNSNNNKQNNLIKLTNCITATKSDSIDGITMSGIGTGTLNMKSSSGNGGNTTIKSSDSGISTLNSLTQRLLSFNFGNDKRQSGEQQLQQQLQSQQPQQNNNIGTGSYNTNSRNHRKTFSLSKSSGSYHTTSIYNNTFNHHNADGHNSNLNSTFIGSLKPNNSKSSTTNSAIVTSYDPMKLIGTPSCPRFDECPLLEPLICKKIAHERLTSLIFREDCFLTACQDGFIYTWARPGYSNIPQHMSSTSPSATPGGTVV